MEQIRRPRGVVAVPASQTQGVVLQRFYELVEAFVRVASERRDLQLRGSAQPPQLGFAVRLQPTPRSPGVEMVLTTDQVTLAAWSQDGERPPLSGQRVLRLDLTRGFQWECLVFPDAGELARTLLKRMEDELRSLDP